MATSTTMKRGDTRPALTITCLDGTSPVDLTNAIQVRVIGSRRGTQIFDTTTTGTAEGVVVRAWEPEDTDETGVINVEVEVTWADTTVQTFPAERYLTVEVKPDLD